MKRKILCVLVSVLLILSLAGCAAYTKHKTNFKSAVGQWELDCIYVDTKPIKFDAQTLEIKKDNTAKIVVTTTNTEGQLTETVYNYTITSGKGTMSLTAEDGSVTEYTFNVDTKGGTLNLSKKIDGAYWHYVYEEIDD